MSGFLETIDKTMADLDVSPRFDAVAPFQVWGSPLTITAAHGVISVALGSGVVPCFTDMHCMLEKLYRSIPGNPVQEFAVCIIAPKFDLWSWSATGIDAMDLANEQDYTEPEPATELYINIGRVSQMLSPMASTGGILPASLIIFAPSCATHILLSGLTHPALPGSIPLEESLTGSEEIELDNSTKFDGTILLEYDLRDVYQGDASMKTIQIGGVSALDAIDSWVQSNFTYQPSRIDTCNVINCNPTCLATIEFHVEFKGVSNVDAELGTLGTVYIVITVLWFVSVIWGKKADSNFLAECTTRIPPSQVHSVRRQHDRSVQHSENTTDPHHELTSRVGSNTDAPLHSLTLSGH